MRASFDAYAPCAVQFWRACVRCCGLLLATLLHLELPPRLPRAPRSSLRPCHAHFPSVCESSRRVPERDASQRQEVRWGVPRGGHGGVAAGAGQVRQHLAGWSRSVVLLWLLQHLAGEFASPGASAALLVPSKLAALSLSSLVDCVFCRVVMLFRSFSTDMVSHSALAIAPCEHVLNLLVCVCRVQDTGVTLTVTQTTSPSADDQRYESCRLRCSCVRRFVFCRRVSCDLLCAPVCFALLAHARELACVARFCAFCPQFANAASAPSRRALSHFSRAFGASRKLTKPVCPQVHPHGAFGRGQRSAGAHGVLPQGDRSLSALGSFAVLHAISHFHHSRSLAFFPRPLTHSVLSG